MDSRPEVNVGRYVPDGRNPGGMELSDVPLSLLEERGGGHSLALSGPEAEGLFSQLIWGIYRHPSRIFQIHFHRDLFWPVTALLLVRWFATASTTMVHMHQAQSPMFFLPPFGISEATYRQIEIYFYAPYGMLLMFVIPWFLFKIATRFYGVTGVCYRHFYQMTAIAYFAPWIPSLFLDQVIIAQTGGGPNWIVPYHLMIVAWESWLVAQACRLCLSLSLERSLFLGALSGLLFVCLGALIIR